MWFRSKNALQTYTTTVETEQQGRTLLSIGENFKIDFWSAVRVGRNVTMMVAPEHIKRFTSQLDSAKIHYSVTSEDVEDWLKTMPKMKAYTRTQIGGHSMDWANYHELSTIFNYLEHLKSNHNKIES